MKSQLVELIAIFGDDITPAESAWYSTAKEVTDARLKRVPAMLEMLAQGEPPDNLPHCYDEETEVFTDKGWKPWSEITGGDLLAAVNNDGQFHFERPSGFVAQQYKGVMYGASSAHVNFLVTPNHRMWVSGRTYYGYKPYEVIDASQLKDKCYRVNTCATYRNGVGGTYDEGWLYGFYLGDGSRRTPVFIVFHLKKERKINALTQKLDALGLVYIVYNEKGGAKTFNVTCDDDLFNGKAHDKEVDESVFSMSLEYRKGVFDGLMASDAHNKRGADSFVYSSVSRSLIRSIDRLCATIGKYSKIGWKTYPEAHTVRILARSVEPVVNPAQSKESTDFLVGYDGMVYCATVTTGLLLTRRNGCVMISGNSVPFEHTLISFRVTSEIATHIHVLKHRVGVSVSSQSQRYMELRCDDYYVPEDWPEEHQEAFCKHINVSFVLYHSFVENLVNSGMDRKRAKESARFVLPYATQIRYRVTFNLLSFIHFQKLRNSEHAQVEIRLVAEEMLRLVKDTGAFNNSLSAWGL